MSSHPIRFIAAEEDASHGALVLANNDDVITRAESIRHQAAVLLQFPVWTDGRAYSQAVLLRGRLRYAGEIRAAGAVLADMLPLLARCGFDAVQLQAGQRVEVAQQVLGLLPVPAYQASLAERAASDAAVRT